MRVRWLSIAVFAVILLGAAVAQAASPCAASNCGTCNAQPGTDQSAATGCVEQGGGCAGGTLIGAIGCVCVNATTCTCRNSNTDPPHTCSPSQCTASATIGCSVDGPGPL
jgi:hypothetical protein